MVVAGEAIFQSPNPYIKQPAISEQNKKPRKTIQQMKITRHPPMNPKIKIDGDNPPIATLCTTSQCGVGSNRVASSGSENRRA